MTHSDCHCSELITRSAIQFHVSPCHGCVVLCWGVGSYWGFELRHNPKLAHLLDAPVDTGSRIAGASEWDQHVGGGPGCDRHCRALKRRDRARATERCGGRKAEVFAAEVCQQVFGDYLAARVGDDAVDVLRR